MVDPLSLFREWFALARDTHPGKHPRAVCVSTVAADGTPEGRIVDLKDVTAEGFLFSTQLDSNKARALAANARVALTFWWDHAGRQVRVTGRAARVPDAQADQFFDSRPRDAQLASWASRQSALLTDPAALEQRRARLREEFAGRAIPRPDYWGAFLVSPERIEFFTFQENRMHGRQLFRRSGAIWIEEWLQP